jgi:hypothetical protein
MEVYQDDLKNNINYISRILTKNGMALEFISDHLKNNIDIVSIAVS